MVNQPVLVVKLDTRGETVKRRFIAKTSFDVLCHRLSRAEYMRGGKLTH